MKNKLIRYITGAGMIALSSSLTTSTADATCSAMPSCSELGYTQTSCTTGYVSIKCPFDTTKMQCVPTSSSSSNISCSDLGYFMYPSCPDGITSIPCPFDESYHMCDCEGADYRAKDCSKVPDQYHQCFSCQKSATETLYQLRDQCIQGYTIWRGDCVPTVNFFRALLQAQYVTGDEIADYIPNCLEGRTIYDATQSKTVAICDKCEALYNLSLSYSSGGHDSLNYCRLAYSAGAYFYSDGTLSQELDNGKTVVGVLIDPAYKRIMSVEQPYLQWATSSSIDVTDWGIGLNLSPSPSGASNTEIILSHTSESVTFPAAQYCRDLPQINGKYWYLPGESDGGHSLSTVVSSSLQAAGKTSTLSYPLWGSGAGGYGSKNKARIYSSATTGTSQIVTNYGYVRCYYNF